MTNQTLPPGTPTYDPKYINPLRAPKVSVGGHEVTGEHWDGNLEGIENSWSNAWDELGYAEYNLSNYAPMQVLCITDPDVDFNPPNQLFLNNMWIGMSNADVLRLQIRLGVYPQTGYFGAITFAAVRAYQSAHGIISTGFVGPLTRKSLNTVI